MPRITHTTTVRRIKRIDDDSGRTTYELPPGEYWIGDVCSVPEQTRHDIEYFGYEPGFYKSKYGNDYMALSSLDTDGAYRGSDGNLYAGCMLIISKKLCDQYGPMTSCYDSIYSFRTFTKPVKVTLVSIGDNFGVNGIEINSADGFHLKIIENEDKEDEIRKELNEFQQELEEFQQQLPEDDE